MVTTVGKRYEKVHTIIAPWLINFRVLSAVPPRPVTELDHRRFNKINLKIGGGRYAVHTNNI